MFGPKRLPEEERPGPAARPHVAREFKSATADIRSQIGLDDIADSASDIKSGLSLTSADGSPLSRHAAETVAGAATGAAIAADPAVSMVAGAPAP